LLEANQAARIKNLVAAAQLPTEPPKLGVARMIELMQTDKKNDAGQIKFVLLNGLGGHMIQSVPEQILRDTLAVCA